MGTGVMARPKKASGAPAKATERPGIVVTLKGSQEWKAWVDDLANHCRTDVSKLIDSALVDYAKARGFTTEAPKR